MSKSTSVAGGAFPCQFPGCGKAFISQPALTMHDNRVHKQSVTVPGQKRTRMSKAEYLRKKREYNRKWRLRKGMKVRPNAQMQNVPEPKKNGALWTPERREKFNSTWRSKNLAKLKARRNQKVTQLHDRIETINKEPLEDPRGFINCCPNCGKNLQAYYLAAGVDKIRG